MLGLYDRDRYSGTARVHIFINNCQRLNFTNALDLI